ncbi:glycosyltransferase family 2 protein [Pseudoalteromonas sp. SR45-1]|uniref:glycosyltransferase n=1 Tax=Pseudoalteromonas sp. SR45-1 TaxID=2760932 RepID=UPI0015FF55D3|nr:glycosyltransferase family 2 protein [Pseudoalteromonas sp. SR45-1]MBB1324342.1 glycosyltransferase family 2 protein [Pseudoalteromonas sp. SR45-1]
MVEITIAICTYKRLEIKQTLISIAEQILPEDMQIRVVVADNDVEPTARPNIEKTASDLGLMLTYVHAPSRNISIARNACLANCKTKWLAFIDDDETVSNKWLYELYLTAVNENAEVVLGPVESIYPIDAPKWIVQCDLHSTKPVFVNGVIETGYTCNTLLNLESDHLKNETFDIALGKSGGEDTDYFSRVFKKGAKLKYAENAIVCEPVTNGRASLNWLAKRRFRMGQTYAPTKFTPTTGRLSVVKLMCKSLAKVMFCSLMSLLFCLHASRRYSWFLRACFHFGVMTKLTGVKNIELY